jgi:hypothetical protein
VSAPPNYFSESFLQKGASGASWAENAETVKKVWGKSNRDGATRVKGASCRTAWISSFNPAQKQTPWQRITECPISSWKSLGWNSFARSGNTKSQRVIRRNTTSDGRNGIAGAADNYLDAQRVRWNKRLKVALIVSGNGP